MLFVAKNEASEVVCRASEQKVTDFMPEQVIYCVLGKTRDALGNDSGSKLPSHCGGPAGVKTKT